MMVTIKTKPNSFFFTGTIKLNPNKSASIDVLKATTKELEDIVESHSLSKLIVPEIEQVKEEFLKRRKACKEGSSPSTSPTKEVDTSKLEKELSTLKEVIDNLKVGKVSSEVYWATTEW